MPIVVFLCEIAVRIRIRDSTPMLLGASSGIRRRLLNLGDHWNDGTAREALADKKWDFVVMQQRPSSLPENQFPRDYTARRQADHL